MKKLVNESEFVDYETVRKLFHNGNKDKAKELVGDLDINNAMRKLNKNPDEEFRDFINRYLNESKILKESFDEMDAAYEVSDRLKRNPSCDEIKKEINKWLKETGWEGDLDPEWIYNFILNDVGDEIGLFESKKLNEELSTDKEAFLILDKLSEDLKKIYDQDNYKIYEDERINKAVNDLITLEIKFPMIKELIHYVAQSTYERRYDSQELLKKIDEIKFKYKNLNKKDSNEINENFLRIIKEDKDNYKEEFDNKLKMMKEYTLPNGDTYLHFNFLAHFNDGSDSVTLCYSDIQDDSFDEEYVTYTDEECLKLLRQDVKMLKRFNATIEEVNEEELFINVSY